MTSTIEPDPRLDSRIRTHFARIGRGREKPGLCRREQSPAQEMCPCFQGNCKAPFTPRGQNKKAVAGVDENITAGKKQEEELSRLSNTLSARNKDFERFSFMVSHDLRGPLSTLMGISEVIDHIKLNQEDLCLVINGVKESLLKIDEIIRVLNDITAGVK